MDKRWREKERDGVRWIRDGERGQERMRERERGREMEREGIVTFAFHTRQ